MANDQKTNLSKPFIVRLCLYNHQIFRKGLLQPYDPNFQHAMVLTMNDLLLAFRPRTAYTHMHEITLVFDGTTQAISQSSTVLLTLYTSFATVRFNQRIVSQMTNEAYKDLYQKTKLSQVQSKQAMFYGLVIQPIDAAKIMKYLVTRCRDKALGTSIYVYAQSYFTHEQMQQKTPNDLQQMIEESQGLRWYKDMPMFRSYGVFGKLEKTYEDSPQIRLSNRSFILEDHMYDLVMAEYWPQTKMPFLGDILTTESYYTMPIQEAERVSTLDKLEQSTKQNPDSPPFTARQF